MKKAIAIATSDWHFWHVAPVWRSNEPNWLEAMGRQLEQIIKKSYELNCPILNAGDIFDHYNPTPETINFLKKKLVNKMYAIPGQHDLQHHVLEHLEKTGFEALRPHYVEYCEPGQKINIAEDVEVYYAPWGTKISDIQVARRNGIKTILIAHKYVWFNDDTRYGGPDIPAGKLSGLKQELQSFDFAVFGDNHIPFRCKIGKCQVINCGTMVRRKLDERNYQTGFTVLFSDGSIEFVEFDIDKDVNLEIQVEDEVESGLDVSSRKFMEELQALEENQIDYRTEVERKVQQLDRNDMEQVFTEIFNNYSEEQK